MNPIQRVILVRRFWLVEPIECVGWLVFFRFKGNILFRLGMAFFIVMIFLFICIFGKKGCLFR